MKKILAVILASLMCVAMMSAFAEENVNCLLEAGSYIIQIPDPEGDLGWLAETGDESIVSLYDADLIEDTFVVRFDAVKDGEATVSAKHYTGIACDEAYTWDLTVKDGAITESTGGSHAVSPDPAVSDSCLIGEWGTEDGMSIMTIEKNPGGKAWDVEIVSAASQGAYVFKTTIYYDCDRNGFVYDKGKYWEVPITDSEAAPELGEASVYGTVGMFTFIGDPGNLILSWEDDQRPDQTLDFYKAGASSTPRQPMTIAPQFGGLNASEGTFPAAFDRAGLKDGTLHGVRLFSEDIYDIAEVAQMAVGDTFVAEGKSVTIDSLDTDEHGNININGGYEAENGYTLTAREDSNGWTTLLWDDFCTYTERGTLDLPLADNVSFIDSWDLDAAALEAGREALTAEGAEAVTMAIAESANDSFDEANTRLVISGDRIVEIDRHYVP